MDSGFTLLMVVVGRHSDQRGPPAFVVITSKQKRWRLVKLKGACEHGSGVML